MRIYSEPLGARDKHLLDKQMADAPYLLFLSSHQIFYPHDDEADYNSIRYRRFRIAHFTICFQSTVRAFAIEPER